MKSSELFNQRLQESINKKPEENKEPLCSSMDISRKMRGIRTTSGGDIKSNTDMNSAIRSAFGKGICGRTIREGNRQKAEQQTATDND